MAFVITLANTKGGCGKSVTALALSRALTESDATGGGNALRVLLVDADPQRTISDAMEIPPSRPSLVNVIDGSLSIRDAIFRDGLFGAHVLPGHRSLLRLFDMPEDSIPSALEPIQGDYDLIMIDTPGTLDMSVQSAMKTVQLGEGMVLIPCQPSYADIKATIFSIQEYEALGVTDYRILLTMIDKRKKGDNVAARDELNNLSNGKVLKNEFPRTVLAERLAGGEDIDQSQHGVQFVNNIRAIAEELMEAATDGTK